MIDNQADILKAFFTALSVQTQPLPHDVQLALNDIGKTGKIDQLVIIAQRYQPIGTVFKEAHNWLFQQAKQQRKGRDIKPQAASEKETTLNTELDNVASEIQESNSLSAILANIQKRLNNEEIIALAPKILNTRNSVEFAKIYFIGQIP